MKEYPSTAVLFEKYGKENGLKPALEIITDVIFALADHARETYEKEGGTAGPRYKMLRQCAAQSYAVARGQSENLVPNFKFDVALLRFMRNYLVDRMWKMTEDAELLAVHIAAGSPRRKELLKMNKHLKAAILTLRIAAQHCEQSIKNGGPTRASWKAYKESKKEAQA